MHPTLRHVRTDMSDAMGINILNKYLAVHLSTFCTTELALVPHFIIAVQDKLIMSFKFPTVRRVDHNHTVGEILEVPSPTTSLQFQPLASHLGDA